MFATLIAAAVLTAVPAKPAPDPTCPNCVAVIELIAVPVSPWTTDKSYIEKFYDVLPSDPAHDCATSGFSDEICKHHWVDPAVHGGGYWDDGVGIEVSTIQLSYAFHPDREPMTFLSDSEFSADLIIQVFDPHTTYDLSKVRALQCGPNGTETPAVHVEWKARTIHDAGSRKLTPVRHIVNAVLRIQTPPATVTACTLDFSQAIRSGTGKTIPPLSWKRHSRLFPDIRI